MSAQELQKPLLIQGAMPSEVLHLVGCLKNQSEETVAGYKFFIGDLDSQRVVVLQSGKGVANTAASLALAYSRFGAPVAVVNQGTAGGHAAALRVGDLVLGTHSVNVGAFKTPHQRAGDGSNSLDWQPMDLHASEASAGEDPNALKMRRYEADPLLLAAAREAGKALAAGGAVKVVEGGIASSEVWNSEIDRIALFHTEYGTLCEEMETATAAQLCARWEVPFLGIRVLTNNITNGGVYDVTQATECQKFVVEVHIHGQFYSTASSSSPFGDSGISISHLNILLPYVERASHTHSPSSPFGLEIEVSGGCFQWFMTNPEVARLEPRYDERGCSQRALVSATSSFAERKTTWIHVEEIKTGKVLRCEVDVDLIHKIEIISTTRTMYKEDVEVLSIQAFDSQGNWFSTLSGLEFAWSVSPVGRPSLLSLNASQLFPSSDEEIDFDSSSSSSSAEQDASLKFIPFATSSVEVSSVVIDMENQGKGAALALVQGTHTGRVRVTARLAEAGYQLTPPASIVMSVLEPLQIYPFHTVYITRHSTLDYQLRTFKRDKYEVVPMPAASYFWYSSAPGTGSITQRGEFTALELGQTEISIQAADVTESQAAANVFVVDPFALQLTSFAVQVEPPQEPVASQYFITERDYVFVLDLLDSQGHRLHFSPKLYSVQWSFTDLSSSSSLSTTRSPLVCNSTSAFRILCSTPRAPTEVRAHVSVIRAASSSRLFTRDSSGSGNVDLTLTQQLHVNHPVAIDPKQVVLPYDATVRHSYTLQASNGSGNYQWSAGDLHIVALNSAGRGSPYSDTTTVSTYTDVGSIGQTLVRAVDSRNPDNRATITVDSAPPAAMRFPPIHTQVQVGRPIQLPLALFDAHGRVFSNCSRLPLTWILSDPTVFALQPSSTTASSSSTTSASDSPPSNVDACTTKTLFALREGHSDITVHYTTAEGSLSAKITISAFEPLVLLTKLVRSEQALISPGATLFLEYQGGPPPLLANPSLYSATLSAQQPEALTIEKLPSKRLPGAYKVTCLTSHEQTLLFTVGNSVAPSNPLAVESSLSLVLVCQPPAQLVLSAPRPDIPRCSSLGPLQILVDAGLPLDITLRVQDRTGHTFDNISATPVIDWTITAPSLASLQPASPWQGRRATVPSGEFTRTLLPGSESGDLEVRAVLPSSSRNGNAVALSAALAVSLVRDVSVSDDCLSVYNHPDNVALLEIYGGSGLGYQVAVNHTGSVTTSVTASAVRVIPSAPGTTRLTLSDPCLTGSRPVQAVVHVSYVGALAVQGIDVIAASSSGSLDVLAFDDRGARFHYGADYLRFDVRLDAALAECADLVSPQSPADSHARFTLYGRRACSGFVTVWSVEPGRVPVASEPFLVHVFDPFRLVPQSITLLAGSRFQPAHVDGPPKRTRISFELSGAELTAAPPAAVLPVVDASTGLLTVPAACRLRAFDVQATVRVGDLVFGADTLSVRVIDQLRGLRLVVPSQDLFVGGEITLRVEGELPDETPFVFASQPQEYKWHSSNSEVGALLPLDPLATDFAARFSVRNAGYTRVSVRAFGRESPSVLLRVREPLLLRTPRRLLLAPGAAYQLRTNKDADNAAAPLQYTVLRHEAGVACTEQGLVVVNGSAGYEHTAVQVYDPVTGTADTVQVALGAVHSMQVLPSATGLFLPVGSNLELQIVFRDQHGRAFDAHPGVQLRTYTNVQEIVAIQLSANQTTMTVTALQLGEAIIRVAVVSPFDAVGDEYIRVAVSTAIEPVAPMVHTGGEVVFRIASKTHDGSANDANSTTTATANWFSEKDSVLTIDRSSGRALARAVGETTIYHNSSVFTYTRVNVVQPSHLVVDPLNAVPFVSNANGLSYDLHVRALTATNVALVDTPPAIRHNLVIRCSVVESQWAVVQTISSLASGVQSSSSALGCRLRPLSPSSLPQSTQPPANLSLLVTVTDRFESYKLSHTHLVPLRSSFAVSADTQQDRIQLNGARKSTTVQVTHFDSKSLHVSSSNPDSVRVDNQGSGVFQLVRGHVPNTNVVVEFRDVITGQVERLVVDVLPEESFYTSSGLASLTQSVIDRPQPPTHQPTDALAPTNAAAVPPPAEQKALRPFFGLSVANIVVLALIIASTLYFFPSLRPQRLFGARLAFPRQQSRSVFETPRRYPAPNHQQIFSPGYDDDDSADGDETAHWIKS